MPLAFSSSYLSEIALTTGKHVGQFDEKKISRDVLPFMFITSPFKVVLLKVYAFSPIVGASILLQMDLEFSFVQIR